MNNPPADRLCNGVWVRHLGQEDYAGTLARMRDFTHHRAADTPDEIWLLQHAPVYTLGVAGRRQHLHGVDGHTPVLRSDRGGQVTWHGPGQIVAYTLVDLRRRRLKVTDMVRLLEQAVIDLLAGCGLEGERRSGAPGVYVHGAKIAALGLKIRQGCCYHGLSLNVSNDLAPFAAIDPCGYAGLPVCRLADWQTRHTLPEVAERLAGRLLALLPA